MTHIPIKLHQLLISSFSVLMQLNRQTHTETQTHRQEVFKNNTCFAQVINTLHTPYATKKDKVYHGDIWILLDNASYFSHLDVQVVLPYIHYGTSRIGRSGHTVMWTDNITRPSLAKIHLQIRTHKILSGTQLEAAPVCCFCHYHVYQAQNLLHRKAIWASEALDAYLHIKQIVA